MKKILFAMLISFLSFNSLAFEFRDNLIYQAVLKAQEGTTNTLVNIHNYSQWEKKPTACQYVKKPKKQVQANVSGLNPCEWCLNYKKDEMDNPELEKMFREFLLKHGISQES